MRSVKPHVLRGARRLGEVGLARAGSESVGVLVRGGFSRTASCRFALGSVASALRMRSVKPHGLRGARRLGEVGVTRAGPESVGPSRRGGFSRTASCRFALGSVGSVLCMRLVKPHGLRGARRLGEVGVVRAGSESVGVLVRGGFSRTASCRFALGSVASALCMRLAKPHGLRAARRSGEVGLARAMPESVGASCLGQSSARSVSRQRDRSVE